MTFSVAWFAIALAANSTDLPAVPVSQAAVVEMAKRRSAQDCSPPTHRCSYRASVDKLYDGSMAWTVFVVQAYVEKDGSLGYPIGGHWLFVYNLDGKFRETVPGL